MKSFNIILDRSDLVKLIDLGLCAMPQSAENLPSESNETISSDCREVLHRILRKDPRLRPSAGNILLME